MMKFALISFPEEDNSLGVIPTNWITSSGRSCYYPCVISEFTKNKLISTRHEPGNDWIEVEMKILRKFETYKTAKSHFMEAEMVHSTGVSDGNSESKTRSRRVSKRPRKKKKIVLPGESSSSDDEIRVKRKFLNPPNSPPPCSSSTDTEFTHSSATNTHLSSQTSPKLADTDGDTLVKLPRCTVQLSPTLKNHTVQSPPKLVNDAEQTPPTPTNNTGETPLTPPKNTVETPTTRSNYTEQSSSTLTNNTVQSPPTLKNSSVQTSPTLTNHSVQTSPTLTNHSVQSPPKLINDAEQILRTPTKNTVETPPILTNHTVQTPTTFTKHTVQTPPTLNNDAEQILPTPAKNTVETPPILTNHTVQTPPTLTNHTVQTPLTFANNAVQSLPTLTNHIVQSPTTCKPFLEPSTPDSLLIDSSISKKSQIMNQNTPKPKFKGLLRPVSSTSCGSISLPPAQPVHVNVNTRPRSLEEAPALSPPLSSPGSSSSSTSVKNEILSLRQNQEMMWVVLGEISQKLDSIVGSLARLESKNDVVLVAESSLEDGENGWPREDYGVFMATFPLNNRTEFREFEDKLLDNTFRHKILRFFNDRNGNTLKNLVASILRKLLADELAEEYSLTGKSGTKKAFDVTRSFALVCQICYRKFVGGEEREIREGVSDWLMQAKFRRLRRIKKSSGLNERRE